MVTIPGYRVTDEQYVGDRSLIYRGERLADHTPVILKRLRAAYPTLADLVRLRNHYTIATHLDLPGIVRPIALERDRQGFALVMPDEGLISLPDYFANPELVADRLQPVLAIALQLAEILHGLYRQGVIHKDIKPSNLLIHPRTGKVKLTDFGIASRLLWEPEAAKHPNGLEGSLAYIAPEQTGRMNRGIDYRADFYALGVTLFELFTGQLPFPATDPLELVHCHLAQPAPSVCDWNPAVPAPVGQIVAKLMAKNAEDRYQSALGLKYDLDMALGQVSHTGLFPPFAIAVRDISDRFLVSEKLYGREAEVLTLLQAFERVSQGTVELLLVAGFSGIGKTTVVHEVHKPIVRQRGYFIQGKFDQFNRDIPFSAFVQAFRDLMGQLLSERDTALQTWKSQILATLGENGQVMIEVIPELERIIGPQPAALELSGTAAQNRFNLLFQQFIQIFTTSAHPLVIFLDDLQWVDSASLKLLELLMQEQGYLLILGAYRDNEVSSVHPLRLTIQHLQKLGTTINTLTLQALSQADMNQWVADTLRCDRPLAEPLTELVYQKTQGNPFFTSQFLKALHQEQLIQFNPDLGYWQCDLSQIKVQSLTEDVVEFMAQQLQKLPAATQALLKLAACIGTQFDLQTLAIVAEQSDIATAAALGSAVQEGLIIPLNQIYKFFQAESAMQEAPPVEFQMLDASTCTYRFLHDRVQQAAYSLIPASQREAVHLQIGRLLLKRTSLEEQDEQLLPIVNQLNRGISLVDQVEERDRLAQLNWRAGAKARTVSAYDAALNYLNTGLQLLSAQGWQNQYRLSLDLHQLAAEAAYLVGAYPQMASLIAVGLQHSQHPLDRVKFHEVQILALVAQNQTRAAVDYACKILSSFGVQLPKHPSKLRTMLGFLMTLYRMAGKTPQDLLALPAMAHPTPLAICNLFNAVGAAAQSGMPEILPFITFLGISLYLRHGNIPKSSMAYIIYAFLLCEKLGRIDTGYAFGKAAIALCHQTASRAALGPTLFLWTRFIAYRKDSLHTLLPQLLEAYQVSLEVGDTEYAAYSLGVYFIQAYWAGQNLVDLQREAIASRPVFQNLQQRPMAALHDLNCQALENLTTRTEDVCQLVGQFFDETAIPQGDRQLHIHTHFRKLQLAYLFQRYPLALEQIAIIEQGLGVLEGTFVQTLLYFYDALVRLAQYPQVSQPQQRNFLAQIKRDRQQLERLAKSAPTNYQHKRLLVEAEYQRLLGEASRAGEAYDLAIAAAKADQFIQEEALANELAARFYLERGREKVAAGYMQEAYYAYARWGAKAKTDHLEQQYPQLLTPILNPTQAAVLDQDSAALSQTVSVLSTSLDLGTVIKASQSLSREIQLDQLLQTLIQLAVTNAGADKAALFLNQDGALHLAIHCVDQAIPSIQTQPLDHCDQFPIALIHYVERTLETVITDWETHVSTLNDPYCLQSQPQSLLCTPILNQGQLVAVLYLENATTSNTFTANRVDLLKLIGSQAAICLENAQLYQQAQTYAQELAKVNRQLEDYSQTLEAKVADRTQELSQAIADLQTAQQEIVNAEKMAALGQLTASIAHEINTPLSVIRGATSNILAAFTTSLQQLPPFFQALSPLQQSDFLALLQASLQSPLSLSTQEERLLRRQLQSYLQTIGIPNPGPIAAQLTLLRLGPDLSPFQSILSAANCLQILQVTYNLVLQHHNALSIQQEVDRAAKIVFALKTYSHHSPLHESALVPITDGIEVALILYQNRLKQGIQLIRHYQPDLPPIRCNPDELTQVWVNLIDNAIYAIGPQGILEITVSLQADSVVVIITDSGCGIPPHLQPLIFDPFFTTKPRGEGSGLGLDIVQQIVRNHAGSIQVHSQPGRTSFSIQLPLKP